MRQLSSANSQLGKSTIGRAKNSSAATGSPIPGALPAPARAVLGGFSRLAPSAAAGLAETMFLTPLRFKAPWREEWWATDAEPLRLQGPTGEVLKAWRWGVAGPTILLVHGWGGRGLQMGAFASPLVAAGFQVVAFDAPGHGGSPGRRSSLPAFAAAVKEAVEQLDDVRGIVAHSFGAAATTLARVGRSDARERLVFVAPAGSFRSVAEQFSLATGFTPGVVTRMQNRIEDRFGIRWQEVEPLGLARSSRLPLMIFHDEQDAEIPWQDSRRLSELWPGAGFHLTQGLGHHKILRHQSILDGTVRFLSETDGAF